MHWFDIGVTIALIVSGVWSCFKGLVREVLSLVGLAAAVFLALRGAPYLTPLLATITPAPWLGHAISFALIFLVVMAIVMLCTKALRLMLTAVGLSPLDRLLGGVFGVAKVVLAVTVLLMLANAYFPTLRSELEAGSVLAPWMYQGVEQLTTWLSQHDDLLQRLRPQR